MMKQLKAKIGVLFGFIATLMFMLVDCQSDVSSFDILFPQNWYTRTLQSCMEVWGDLDQIIADEDIPFEQCHIIVDGSIGKMSYSLHCVENRVDTVVVDDDDLAYLIRLLRSLEHKCEKLAGRQFDDKLSCLQIRIKQLYMQLHQLIQTDSATFSSRD